MSASARMTRCSPKSPASFGLKIKAAPADLSQSSQLNSEEIRGYFGDAPRILKFKNSGCVSGFPRCFPCSSTKRKSPLRPAAAATDRSRSAEKSSFQEGAPAEATE